MIIHQWLHTNYELNSCTPTDTPKAPPTRRSRVTWSIMPPQPPWPSITTTYSTAPSTTRSLPPETSIKTHSKIKKTNFDVNGPGRCCNWTLSVLTRGIMQKKTRIYLGGTKGRCFFITGHVQGNLSHESTGTWSVRGWNGREWNGRGWSGRGWSGNSQCSGCLHCARC